MSSRLYLVLRRLLRASESSFPPALPAPPFTSPYHSAGKPSLDLGGGGIGGVVYGHLESSICRLRGRPPAPSPAPFAWSLDFEQRCLPNLSRISPSAAVRCLPVGTALRWISPLATASVTGRSFSSVQDAPREDGAALEQAKTVSAANKYMKTEESCGMNLVSDSAVVVCAAYNEDQTTESTVPIDTEVDPLGATNVIKTEVSIGTELSRINNTDPFGVSFVPAGPYLMSKEGPPMLVTLPDMSSELYCLIVVDPKQPYLLSEPAKIALRPLIVEVLWYLENGKCLDDSSITMDNLLMSSLGTLKLRSVTTVALTPSGRTKNLVLLADLLERVLQLRHDSLILDELPQDFRKLLMLLRTHGVSLYLIKFNVSLLPATSYGLAYLKLYDLLMEDGLLSINETEGLEIIRNLPYQFSSEWVSIANQHELLFAWYKFRTYNATNAMHLVVYGRNIFSHATAYRILAIRKLGSKLGFYPREAVHVLFQYSYVLLLPAMQESLCHYFDEWFISSLRFEDLFPAVPHFYLSEKTESIRSSKKDRI